MNLPTLGDYARKYCLRTELTHHAEQNLKRNCDQFERWFHGARGGPLTLDKLDEDLLSEWLSVVAGTRSSYTVKSWRISIITVWRAAARERLAVRPDPYMVRAIKLARLRPQAWTRKEIGRLIDAAENMPGVVRRKLYNGQWWECERRLFFPAAIMFAYETGLSRKDVLKATLGDIDPERFTVVIERGKTDVQYVRPISPQTWDRLQRFDHPLRRAGDKHGLVIPWLGGAGSFTRALAKIVQRADLPGSLKWLRRACATEVRQICPGAETQALGHTTDRTDKFYLDPRRLPAGVLPPSPLPPDDEAA